MNQYVTMEQFDQLEDYIVKNLATKEDLKNEIRKLERITEKILKKLPSMRH